MRCSIRSCLGSRDGGSAGIDPQRRPGGIWKRGDIYVRGIALLIRNLGNGDVAVLLLDRLIRMHLREIFGGELQLGPRGFFHLPDDHVGKRWKNFRRFGRHVRLNERLSRMRRKSWRVDYGLARVKCVGSALRHRLRRVAGRAGLFFGAFGREQREILSRAGPSQLKVGHGGDARWRP